MKRIGFCLMAMLCLGLAACSRPDPEPEPVPVVVAEPVYDKWGNPV